ncbi:MAG TPA: mucin-2 protein [Nocardioides sp.]|nr:mucin-2 protein [Nocardioides sp.]
MAQHRHKRETNARRLNPFRAKAVTIAAPLALLATGSAVGLGVVQASPPSEDLFAASLTNATPAVLGDDDEESRGGESLSRSAPARIEREPSKVEAMMAGREVKAAIRAADTKKWTTAPLNLWDEPGDDAKKLGEIDEDTRVLVTGRALYDRVEIVVDGESRWVTAGYLSTEKPFTIGGDCTNGSSVEAGVSENIVKVHEAVCAEFPEITTYGTFRGDGEHAQGIAVDIMVSGERGFQVAEFVREYYVELGVSYIIYSQRIWSVERASEGWRAMSDRGSTTANHYDHVHVTTY